MPVGNVSRHPRLTTAVANYHTRPATQASTVSDNEHCLRMEWSVESHVMSQCGAGVIDCDDTASTTHAW